MTKKLGLVLGSGAARGWAHVGVIRELEEIGVRPDIVAGCSVGALVGGAWLVGALEEFEAWGRELSPLSAIGAFNFWVNRGGLVDTKPAFEAFAAFDKNIEDLPVRFGAVAADLGTGEEVWMTQGSVIEAARASSAIPVLFHAVQRKSRVNATVTAADEQNTALKLEVRSEGKDGIFTSWDQVPSALPQSADNQLRLIKNALQLL